MECSRIWPLAYGKEINKIEWLLLQSFVKFVEHKQDDLVSMERKTNVSLCESSIRQSRTPAEYYVICVLGLRKTRVRYMMLINALRFPTSNNPLILMSINNFYNSIFKRSNWKLNYAILYYTIIISILSTTIFT